MILNRKAPLRRKRPACAEAVRLRIYEQGSFTPSFIVNKPWSNTALDYRNHNDIPPGHPNPDYPAGVSPTQTATSGRMYRLNATTNRTGLELVVKVMAGDRIDLFGRSYHTNTTTVSNSNSTPLSVLQIAAALLAGPGGALGSKGITASPAIRSVPE